MSTQLKKDLYCNVLGCKCLKTCSDRCVRFAHPVTQAVLHELLFFFLASLLNFVEHNLAHILSEYSEPSQTNQKGTTLEGEKKRS